MDEGGLGGFGLSDAFQADAAPSAKLEPDFHHLKAGKLVEQLPWRQRGRAGFEFVLKTHPQAVSQEGDHDMGFDPLGGEVPDWTDGQVAFECAEDGFDFGELDVLAPRVQPDRYPLNWCATDRHRRGWQPSAVRRDSTPEVYAKEREEMRRKTDGELLKIRSTGSEYQKRMGGPSICSKCFARQAKSMGGARPLDTAMIIAIVALFI